MRQFFDFMIALDVQADVQPIIIGNSELVPIAEKNEFRIVESIGAYGKGYRPSGLIGKVGR